MLLHRAILYWPWETCLSCKCSLLFHHREIRCVRQSLDAGSPATLIHAFVTSRVDYYNAVLAGSPRFTTDKLQRVMNFAARDISNTRKFDSVLSRLLHDELHWLDVTDRVRFKLACWCISLFMERLRRTWWTAAHQLPTLLVVSICSPPVSGSWLFCVIAWTISVVGVLLSQARRPGIRYLTVFVTQHWDSTCLEVSWRRTFLQNIDEMYSAH